MKSAPPAREGEKRKERRESRRDAYFSPLTRGNEFARSSVLLNYARCAECARQTRELALSLERDKKENPHRFETSLPFEFPLNGGQRYRRAAQVTFTDDASDILFFQALFSPFPLLLHFRVLEFQLR